MKKKKMRRRRRRSLKQLVAMQQKKSQLLKQRALLQRNTHYPLRWGLGRGEVHNIVSSGVSMYSKLRNGLWWTKDRQEDWRERHGQSSR